MEYLQRGTMLIYPANKLRLLLLLAPLILSLSEMSGAADQDPAAHSDALIVASGAKSVRYVKYEGTDQVSYQLQADYPAHHVIETISQSLKEKGWEPLKEDYLNPGLPSSHVRGWTSFIDATKSPERSVHQWGAQWQNEAQDIVSYALIYEYPRGKTPNLKSLQVYASFIPAPLAKAAREATLKYRSNSSEKGD